MTGKIQRLVERKLGTSQKVEREVCSAGARIRSSHCVETFEEEVASHGREEWYLSPHRPVVRIPFVPGRKSLTMLLSTIMDHSRSV